MNTDRNTISTTMVKLFDRGKTRDGVHLLCRAMFAVVAVCSNTCKNFSKRIDLEIVVNAAIRVLNEELYAGVFPLGTVVILVLCPKVKATHPEIHYQRPLGASYAAGAKWCVREICGPVYTVYVKTGALQFKGGVKILVFKICEWYSEGFHKACMS